MPRTLVADLAAAERVVSAVLAALVLRARTGRGVRTDVAIVDAAMEFNAPLRYGLTDENDVLGGGLPAYNLYRASDGWIAVAALEAHFMDRLRAELQLETLDVPGLRTRFRAARWHSGKTWPPPPICRSPRPQPFNSKHARKARSMQLSGRTFLVTGGGSGLGAACVHEFAGAGANVVICDVSQRGDALARQLGPTVRFARTDVTDESQVGAAIALAQEAFGGLHGAINCAGIATAERAIGRDGPQPLAHFTKVVTVNLIGTFNVVRLVAAKMLERPVEPGDDRGVIVCTASVAAYDGQVGQAAYAASKGGVVALTLPLAREFAQHQIRVATHRSRDLRYADAGRAAGSGAGIARQANAVPGSVG